MLDFYNPKNLYRGTIVRVANEGVLVDGNGRVSGNHREATVKYDTIGYKLEDGSYYDFASDSYYKTMNYDDKDMRTGEYFSPIGLAYETERYAVSEKKILTDVNKILIEQFDERQPVSYTPKK